MILFEEIYRIFLVFLPGIHLSYPKNDLEQRMNAEDNCPTALPKILKLTYVNGLNEPGDYREQELRGFLVRVTAKGTKTYYVKNSVRGGRSCVLVKIGRHGQVTTNEARILAKEVLHQMSKGIDPNLTRKADKVRSVADAERQRSEDIAKSVTLEEVLDRYLRDRTLKESTAKDYRKLVKLCFADWLAKPINVVSRDMIDQRFRVLSERSKAQANKAMRVFRALWNFADAAFEDNHGHSIVGENPTKRLKQLRAWHVIPRRERVVKDHELKKWYAAVMGLDNSTVRDYLRLLLFTGLRRTEACGLRWSDVDFQSKTFTVIDTKNGRDHMLPMSDFVESLLKERRVLLKKSGDYGTFVFPGVGEGKFLHDPRKQILKAIEKSGVDFTSHDLRRTISTVADRIGIDQYTVARLLNHKTTSVTQGYIISDAERLRQPLKLITEYLLAQIGA
jgi:integrase